MDLNQRGRRALERFRARRGSQPLFDRRTLLIAACAAVVVAGAAWAVERWLGLRLPGGAELESFSLYLHRQGCPGPCPVYAVLVRGDGTVQYEGVANVATEGARAGTVDALALRALLNAVVRSGIEEAPAAIKPGTPGCATWSNGRELLQLGVTRGGRTRTVDLYPGCEPGDPKLEQLGREIDALIGTARWVSPDAGPGAT